MTNVMIAETPVYGAAWTVSDPVRAGHDGHMRKTDEQPMLDDSRYVMQAI